MPHPDKTTSAQDLDLRSELLSTKARHQELRSQEAERVKQETAKEERRQRAEAKAKRIKAAESAVERLPEMLRNAARKGEEKIDFPIQLPYPGDDGYQESIILVKEFCEEHRLYGTALNTLETVYEDERWGNDYSHTNRFTSVEISYQPPRNQDRDPECYWVEEQLKTEKAVVGASWYRD